MIGHHNGHLDSKNLGVGHSNELIFDFVISHIEHCQEEYWRPEDGDTYKNMLKHFKLENHEVIEDRKIQKAFIEHGRKTLKHKKTQEAFKDIVAKKTLRDMGIEQEISVAEEPKKSRLVQLKKEVEAHNQDLKDLTEMLEGEVFTFFINIFFV